VRGKVLAGAFAAGIIVGVLRKGKFQNLTQNGVRGGLVKIGGRTFVVYTAKSDRMRLQIQGLTDKETLGLMVTFSGKTYLVYTEK
jgi:hypothetical protein